ncbi:MAG: group II intron reverse transcriptase/maturase, partial [Planctomycetota bacterium]
MRFVGYDIKRGDSKRRVMVQRRQGRGVQRTCMQKLTLLMPQDKCDAFAKEYGQRQGWQGRDRIYLVNLSELEILMIYNAEIRGFLGYYALADNLTSIVSSILWLTTTSFLKTLAAKRRSTLKKVAKSLKRGPNRYVIPHRKKDGTVREYALVASTGQVEREQVTYGEVDAKPNTWKYRRQTELGQRLLAHQCEWCGTTKGSIEVPHVR